MMSRTLTVDQHGAATRTAISTRAMLPEDLDAVLEIQLGCYDAEKQESRESFISKLLASPQTCFVALRGLKVVGYLVAVPAVAGSPVPLNAQGYAAPAKPNALYLHDLAVDPALRGAGVASVLLAPYLQQLKNLGLSYGALTAVNDSSAFWHRHGFREVTPTGVSAHHLGAYGHGAQYMLCPIQPTR